MKKVFVSGCYDLLHSGHIRFFEEASQYGELYVSIGNDENIFLLKNKVPTYSQDERLYMVQNISFVKEAKISSSNGIFDFVDWMLQVKPDIFIVNKDGHSKEKEELIKSYDIEYIVLERIPKKGLIARSTTSLSKCNLIPYRIDLAGGWLDQPFLSQRYAGSVLTISIEPTYNFQDRSGMATSTRKKANELWGNHIPFGDEEKLSKMLFSFENPPGSQQIAGAQDSIGIVLKGLTKQYYTGSFWPQFLERVLDEAILNWLEKSLVIIPLKQRLDDFDPLKNSSITLDKIKKLSIASLNCWEAITNMDIEKTGKYITESFKAQIEMFPNMLVGDLSRAIGRYENDLLGYKVSGAGGGGYLIGISEKEIDGAIKIKIRR